MAFPALSLRLSIRPQLEPPVLCEAWAGVRARAERERRSPAHAFPGPAAKAQSIMDNLHTKKKQGFLLGDGTAGHARRATRGGRTPPASAGGTPSVPEAPMPRDRGHAQGILAQLRDLSTSPRRYPTPPSLPAGQGPGSQGQLPWLQLWPSWHKESHVGLVMSFGPMLYHAVPAAELRRRRGSRQPTLQRDAREPRWRGLTRCTTALEASRPTHLDTTRLPAGCCRGPLRHEAWRQPLRCLAINMHA